MKNNDGKSIILPNDYTVFDLETTGLSVKYAEVIEIGALKVKNRRVSDEFHTYVRPIRGIPQRITEITGITARMTSSAPYIDEAVCDFLSFIGDDVLVAHNASFDMRFIGTICAFFGYRFTNEPIDSLKLARVFVKAPDHKLETLKNLLGIDLPSHNALDDCRVTHALFEHCRSLMAVSTV